MTMEGKRCKDIYLTEKIIHFSSKVLQLISKDNSNPAKEHIKHIE